MPGRSFLAWPQGGPFNPTVVPNPLPNAEVTASYSFQFSATSGTPGYSWTSAGLTGTGFSLSATGLLTGVTATPTTIPFTITVTDANGAQSTANESLVVIPGPSITTNSLPNATVGTAYGFPMAVSGGTPPYIWAITSDTPDTGNWLSINSGTGLLSGTPGTAETESLTIKVTDSLNVASLPANFTLTVQSNSGNAPNFMWPSYSDSTSLCFYWWVPLSQLSWSQASITASMSGTTTMVVSAITGFLYNGDTVNLPGGGTLTVTTAALNNQTGNYVMSGTATFASQTISKAVGSIPDYYKVYRNGTLVNMSGLGLTNPGVTSSPVEAPSNRSMSWHTDNTVVAGTSYTYQVSAVYGTTESALGPALTMAARANGPTILPTPAAEPNTWIQPYTAPTGTVWTCTNTATTAVAGTGALGNVGCSFQYALNNSNQNGGDWIILTAGATYPIPNTGGYLLPAYTGTNGWTYISSSEDPGFKSGGKLPAYNGSVNNYVNLVVNCTAVIPTTTTSATLAPSQAGITDASGNWLLKSGWYYVAFTEPTIVQSNGSLHEERVCVFTQGSSTFTWGAHNNNYTAQTLTAQANATIMVFYLVGVTPWDANDNAAMPKIDIGSTVNGTAMQCAQAGGTTKVRIVGVNFHAGPNLTTAATGIFRLGTFGIGSDGLGDGTPLSESIYLDRCCFGSHAGDADYGHAQHGIGWIYTNHLLVNQCYIFGIASNPNNSGQDANNFGMNGRYHCIQNTYLSCVGETWIYGGLYIAHHDLPSDVVFRGNLSHKPLDWVVGAVDGHSNQGSGPYSRWGINVKNHLEQKVGFRFSYYGNMILNSWTANQAGYHGAGFAFDARIPQGLNIDRNGSAPWMQVQDIDVHDNLLYRVQTAIVGFTGEQTPTACDARVAYHNNLSYTSPPLTQNDRNQVYQAFGPCVDHLYDHNTAIINQSMNNGGQGVPRGFYFPPPPGINTASDLYIGPPSTPGSWHSFMDGFTFTNNIVDSGGTNWAFNIQTTTNPWAFPNVTWNKNLTINDTSTYSGNVTYVNVPYASIGFQNFAGTQTMPLRPSDWNVVSGSLVTGSTTGGPIGCIFGNVQVTTLSLPNAVVGSAYSTTLTASGGSGSYAWNLESAAPNRHLWLGITRTGALYGVPQCDNVGQSNVPDTVTVRVTDTATGNSGTATLSLNITNSGTLAINTPTTLPTAVNAGAYFYQLTAAGGAPPYLFWKITGHTGSNSWFISNNGWLWGVPTTNSTDTLTVTVTDVTGTTSAAVTFSITTNNSIQLAGIDRINNVINLPDARAGHKYRHQIRPANGGTGAGQTFSIMSGTLPAGLSMSAAGLITGTPTQSGNASCSLQCVDNGPNTSAAVPIALNVAAQSKGTRPTANTGSGFFVDTTGNFCDPNGFHFTMRGLNRAHFDQQSTAYSNGGCSAVRYELYASPFRGANPGGGAQPFSTYIADANAQHTATPFNQYVILALFYLPGTLTQINTNPTTGNAASTIGTAAAYWCDNVATYNATLQNKAGINIANEWGMTGANFPLCYSAAWSKGVGTGVWQMPVANVNTSTGVITLAATVNDATNPLAGCAQIGYVYFAGGGVSKAIAISTTGGSSGAWTVTASTLSDVAGWTSGGTISGGAIGMVRAAGYTDPIHIDAGAQFGQIKTTFMQNGPTIAASDPLQNIVLAYHAYGQTVNYGARVSSVTTGANAVIHLQSIAGNHPLQPTSLSSNPITKAWVTGVSGMTGANGNLSTTGSGIGGSAGAWIVPTTATTTGTYASGGFVIPGFDSTNTFNYGHIDVLAANIQTLATGGVAVMMEEFGPEAPAGDSPTIMGFQEVVQACEANGLHWACWAGDDNRPTGTSDGNPAPFNYGVNGTNSASGVYNVPGDLISSGIDVVLNPRYGIHTLAQPASSYL